MTVLKSELSRILKKCKDEGKYRKFTLEENEQISEEISEELEKSRSEYLKWENESILEANNVYIDT